MKSMRIRNEDGGPDMFINSSNFDGFEYKVPGFREQSWCDNQGFYYGAQLVYDKFTMGITFCVDIRDVKNGIPKGYRKYPHNKLWGSWEQDPCRKLYFPVRPGNPACEILTVFLDCIRIFGY